MADCDNCGDEVIHVWRHRSRTETMTHGEITWVCADCHPELPDVLKHEETGVSGETVATTEGGESTAEKTVVTDGGAASVASGTSLDAPSSGRSMVCPDCAGETINGQGLYDCLDCSWTGAR
jgi:hypothetical protein